MRKIHERLKASAPNRRVATGRPNPQEGIIDTMVRKRREAKVYEQIGRKTVEKRNRPQERNPMSGATLASREFTPGRVNQTSRPESIASMKAAGEAAQPKRTGKNNAGPGITRPARTGRNNAGPGITRPVTSSVGKSIHMNTPGGRVEANVAAQEARDLRNSRQQVNLFKSNNDAGKIRGVAPVGFVPPATEGSKAADTQKVTAAASHILMPGMGFVSATGATGGTGVTGGLWWGGRAIAGKQAVKTGAQQAGRGVLREVSVQGGRNVSQTAAQNVARDVTSKAASSAPRANPFRGYNPSTTPSPTRQWMNESVAKLGKGGSNQNPFANFTPSANATAQTQRNAQSVANLGKVKNSGTMPISRQLPERISSKPSFQMGGRGLDGTIYTQSGKVFRQPNMGVLKSSAAKGGERVTGSSTSYPGIARAKRLPEGTKSYPRPGSTVGRGGKIDKNTWW